MAKRKLSTHQKRRNECMSKEIPKQRRIMMKRLGKKKLTRKQHNDAFTRAAHICP